MGGVGCGLWLLGAGARVAGAGWGVGEDAKAPGPCDGMAAALTGPGVSREPGASKRALMSPKQMVQGRSSFTRVAARNPEQWELK